MTRSYSRLVQHLGWVVLALVVVNGTALAGGTPSGTTVTNKATVTYKVGAVDQDPVDSNDATFVVDNRVVVVVTTVNAGGEVQVPPASTGQVLTYTVTNSGNTVQDYSLSLVALASDDFDATSVGIFVDSNANGTYDSGTDTATYIDELGIDQSVNVFIVGDIPSTQSDGDRAEYDLVAQTAAGGTSGTQGSDITSDDAATADDPNAVDIVFADAAGTADTANDGKHSSRDAYVVLSATLSVVKSSSVVDDPINGTTNPKAIPGATMRYTIMVTNSGSAAATSVVLVDDIPTNTTYDAGTITLDGSALTDAGSDDAGDYNVTNAGAVTVSVASIAASGGSASVTFDVVVD